ncbi:MAG: hypothetical protein KDA87_16950, partial [Planctomycetales bacterium]|nr:hypothetical protein [Planctomycetales bacterium]
TQTISLGPRPELSHSELGERIFTDATRSHDHWFSCHSCHINGHSNGRLADTQGDGSYGTPKRVPSLFGVADTSPWSWTGHFAALEDQLQKTAQSTMIGRKFSRDELVHLQSFLSGLQAPAAAQPATPEAAEQVVQGKAVFERRQCTACHHGHAFSAHTVFDVGLVDEQGETHFNPPSLIGVRLRQTFFMMPARCHWAKWLISIRPSRTPYFPQPIDRH